MLKTLNDLAVQVDGKKLLLDPTVQSTALVQNWQFPSKDGNSMNVSWERYDAYHAAPQVNFTASKLAPAVPGSVEISCFDLPVPSMVL